MATHAEPTAAAAHGGIMRESLDMENLKKLDTADALHVDLANAGALKGDDSDGRVSWTTKQVLATISLSGLYVGSQLPLFFVGGTLSFIAAEIGGTIIEAWLPISYSLVLAAVAPFCGYLQDLFGRRLITLTGGIVLCVGIVIVGTARSPGAAIAGMAIAGGGAAIGELTALAGTAELVPVNKRGIYLALVTFFVLPFCPWPLYTQLLANYSTWRWGLWITLIYNGIAVAGIAIFYFPESNLRGYGLSKSQIIKRLDIGGAFLSISGLTLFLVGLTAGGYNRPWSSAYVLCTLIIGFALMAAFVVWEWKIAKVPMIPRELFAGQRIVAMAYIVAFIAGMWYYALINFLPFVNEAIYVTSPVEVGLKGLGPGFSVTFGAVIVNAALSIWKGHNRELLLVSAIMAKFDELPFLAAFGGALAAVNPTNPHVAIAMEILAGFGIGGILVPAATVAVTVCPDELIATCIALSLSIRVIGGSIGYAIYYNVSINKLTAKLPVFVATFAVKAGLPLTSATEFVTLFLTAPNELASANIPGLTETVVAAATLGSQYAYAESLKYVWYTSIAFGVLSIMACLFLGDISKYMTNRIAANIRR
ncbi:hypothetical protein LTR74_018395 [Friedmanniomyces endolithicus]|nr:hypothetical protein LTR74_018395 [Friedmanniomyces endolithicus]